MENENTSNNIDITPIVEGLETLNKGNISNGEKLDSIIEYLIAVDNEEAKKEEAAYDQKQADLKASEAKEAEVADQYETYEVLLTDIRDQAILQNYILSGQIFFMGVLFGTLIFKILWDRFIR